MSERTPDERRRRVLQLTGLTIGGGLVGSTGVVGADDDQESGEGDAETGEGELSSEDGDAGLVTVESDDDFETTLAAVESRIEASPLTLISTVNHAANADSVDMELPPTTLLVFGNPNTGTQLMQQHRSVAIDLPQKMLIWCDDGTTYVTYNDPQYLADRHGLEDVDELLTTISNALSMLATGGDSSSDS